MSPIVGLTDTPPAFIKLGRIKKGDTGGKNGAPRDLDYFRLTYQPSQHSDLIEKKFVQVYGKEPREINVRFASNNPTDVWDANYECYKKGGLIAKCAVGPSGPYWIYYRDPENSEVLVRNGIATGREGRDFMEKPIDLLAPVYFSADKKPNYLKTYGRLQVVIPELTNIEDASGKKIAIVGFFEFVPKSPRDIRNISGELAMYDGFAKSAGRTINGVPFKIIRRQEDVTKKIDGKLVMDKSWVCHLDCSGEWGRLALEAVERLALPEVVDGEYYEEDDFEDEVSDTTPKLLSRNDPKPVVTVGNQGEKVEDESIDPLEAKAVEHLAKQWKITPEKAAEQIAASNKFYSGMLKSEFKRIVQEGAK